MGLAAQQGLRPPPNALVAAVAEQAVSHDEEATKNAKPTFPTDEVPVLPWLPNTFIPRYRATERLVIAAHYYRTIPSPPPSREN